MSRNVRHATSQIRQKAHRSNPLSMATKSIQVPVPWAGNKNRRFTEVLVGSGPPGGTGTATASLADPDTLFCHIFTWLIPGSLYVYIYIYMCVYVYIYIFLLMLFCCSNVLGSGASSGPTRSHPRGPESTPKSRKQRLRAIPSHFRIDQN